LMQTAPVPAAAAKTAVPINSDIRIPSFMLDGPRQITKQDAGP